MHKCMLGFETCTCTCVINFADARTLLYMCLFVCMCEFMCVQVDGGRSAGTFFSNAAASPGVDID